MVSARAGRCRGLKLFSQQHGSLAGCLAPPSNLFKLQSWRTQTAESLKALASTGHGRQVKRGIPSVNGDLDLDDISFDLRRGTRGTAQPAGASRAPDRAKATLTQTTSLGILKVIFLPRCCVHSSCSIQRLKSVAGFFDFKTKERITIILYESYYLFYLI